LPVIARRAAMRCRTLSRRFREHVGMTPAAWIARARVREAQRLLETTRLSVEAVAKAAGYGSATVLRDRFAAIVGVSPLAYRRSFSSEQRPVQRQVRTRVSFASSFSSSVRLRARWHASAQVGLDFVSELCHIAPKPNGHTATYGDTRQHTVVAENGWWELRFWDSVSVSTRARTRFPSVLLQQLSSPAPRTDGRAHRADNARDIAGPEPGRAQSRKVAILGSAGST
jgi:AraC-like DNA-binding protein